MKPWVVGLIGVGTLLLGVGVGVGLGIGEQAPIPGVVTASAGSAAAFDCPAGIAVDSYVPGTRVFVVGRDDSGNWLQVRDLGSLTRTAWVDSDRVILDDGYDDLPVTDCPTFTGDLASSAQTTTSEEVTTTTLSTSATTEGSATTSSSTTSTTTSPSGTTTTSPSTTTTQGPDEEPPNLAFPAANPSEVWELDEDFLKCPPGTDRDAEVSVVATDNVGVASVDASWTIGGSAFSVAMVKSGSLYRTTFGPFPYLTVPDNTTVPIKVVITATDTSGNNAKTSTEVDVHSLGECFG